MLQIALKKIPLNPPLQRGKLACEWGIFVFFEKVMRFYVFPLSWE